MITRFGLLTLVLTLAMGGAAHAQMRVGWQTGDVNTEFTFAVETKKFEGEGLRLELKPPRQWLRMDLSKPMTSLRYPRRSYLSLP